MWGNERCQALAKAPGERPGKVAVPPDATSGGQQRTTDRSDPVRYDDMHDLQEEQGEALLLSLYHPNPCRTAVRRTHDGRDTK